MKTYAVAPKAERTTSVACNVCGSPGRSPFLTCEGFTFYRCDRCGLVYQHPQPVFEDLRKRYADDYFTYELENDENFFHLMKLGLEDVGFFDRDMADLDNRRFLDIGCATGLLVRHMADLGWKARGVEICRESARYGIDHRGVEIDIGTLEEADYPDEHFAVVHFSHVIEHVPDPKALLGEVHRVLSPNGRAIVTTPNVAGLQARLFGSRWRSAIRDHLTLFSKDTLRRLFSETGFAVERSVTWGGLAVGTIPRWLKKPVDRAAKRFGFGDVMLFEVRKE